MQRTIVQAGVIRKAIPVVSLCAPLIACGGGGGVGGGNNTNQTPPAQTLQAEIDQLFPFVANAPFDVAFSCERINSQLTYYFDFRLNNTFQVFIELDNHQQVSFTERIRTRATPSAWWRTPITFSRWMKRPRALCRTWAWWASSRRPA